MVDFNKYNKNKQPYKNPFDSFSLSLGGKSKDVGLDDPFDFFPTDNNVVSGVGERELRLHNGKVITFNDEQFEGLRKIRLWLKDKTTFFTLAGYAGTGKSSIVKKILDGYNRSVAVSAPTHKAKKVIMNMTGLDGITLHGLLGLRPDIDLDNFNPNDPKFNPIAKPKLSDYNLVVIDEASMINIELFELLKSTADGTYVKILFMGDPAQIPPVGEKESVVFFDTTIEIHWLTKVERQQDGNPLLPIFDTIRNNLHRTDSGIRRVTNLNESGEGVIFTNNKETFRKSVLDKFITDEYSKDTDYVKLIAWRNDTVMKSNRSIRLAMFGRDEKIVEVGDVLMGYRSVIDSSGTFNIIENSGDYRVMSSSKLEENEYGIFGYSVNLRENIGKGVYTFRDVFVVNSRNHDNLHKYAEMHDFFRDIAKISKKEWRKYYKFRRENMIMLTITKHRNGNQRVNSDVIVKDLDYGYAITGHKSQGSTYSHVMILEDDIDLNWLIKERNQIKYVSLTRPTTTAVVLTQQMYEE